MELTLLSESLILQSVLKRFGPFTNDVGCEGDCQILIDGSEVPLIQGRQGGVKNSENLADVISVRPLIAS